MLNDFLSHLASHGLRSAEVDSATSELRPRIASRFEPPVTPIMPLGGTPLDAEAAFHAESMHAARPDAMPQMAERDQSVTQHTRSLPQDEPVTAMPIHHEHGVDEMARAKRVEWIGIPVPRVAVRSETPPVASSPNRAVLMAPPSLGSHERLGAQLEPSSQLSRRLAPPIEPAQPIGIDRGPARDDALQLPTTSINQRRVTPAVAAPQATPSAQPLSKVMPDRIGIARPTVQSLTSVSETRIVPVIAMSERKPQPPEMEAVPSAPTIHVTIGRIEVRAAPPIASPKRNPPASLAMSLDEYLRQRRGGDR